LIGKFQELGKIKTGEVKAAPETRPKKNQAAIQAGFALPKLGDSLSKERIAGLAQMESTKVWP
jgi:hypothetical protein